MAIRGDVYAAGTLTLNANTTAGSSADLSIETNLSPSNLIANARMGSLTVASSGSISVADTVSLKGLTVNINNSVSATNEVGITSISISDATTVNLNSSLSAQSISVAAPGGAINVAAAVFAPANTVTLSADTVTFLNKSAISNSALSVTATSAINLNEDYAAGATVLAAPIVNMNANWSSTNLELRTNRVNWGAAGAFNGGSGSVLTINAPTAADTTTFNLANNLTLTASRININRPLAWSTYQLSLNANQTPALGGPAQGVALSASMTGTNGAKLMVMGSGFTAGSGSPEINLTGTPTAQAAFTPFGTTTAQTEGVQAFRVGVNSVTVTVDNTGGGGGGSGSSETTVVVTPVATVTTSTAAAVAAEAAAKAAADAAAAKAIADAAIANAATLDIATKVVVEQAITQAVATVVASTSAAVFVAPAPAPPVTTATSGASTTTSSASTTTSTDTTASSSSTSTTSTATTASTTAAITATTTTATTTSTTTATAGTSSTTQSTTVTQEFVEPLSATALSSTTSTVSDPGDKSVATTSTTSGPTSQTATPASSTTAAPAAPALSPVAVSKDGADAGDFTLQTVKPPAPVSAPKQQARTTERVTNTPVSPGISLQSTQKTPPPSGSVLGREISGAGNSSAW
jgi:hypothetical protein